MKTLFVLVLVSGCTAGRPTQADCDEIAQEIRTHGGTRGICSSTKPTDISRFGKACNALTQCEASL